MWNYIVPMTPAARILRQPPTYGKGRFDTMERQLRSCALSANLIAGKTWPLNLAPAIARIQNVEPGLPCELGKARVVFTITNNSRQDTNYALVCRKPSHAGLWSWEHGFAEIPDPAWFKLDKENFAVPAKSALQVGLTIRVPNKPECFNRKWMLAVVLTAERFSRMGLGLSVAARVQIETVGVRLKPSLDLYDGFNLSEYAVQSLAGVQ